MKCKLYSAKRVPTGVMGRLAYEIDPIQTQMVVEYLKQEEKHGNVYRLEMDNSKPRTTGWRSQNHRINGHCQVIAQSTGNSFSAVKERMKMLAIDRGYPIETLVDGSVMPVSEADISVEEATMLVETINQFAAEWSIILPEYPDAYGGGPGTQPADADPRQLTVGEAIDQASGNTEKDGDA